MGSMRPRVCEGAVEKRGGRCAGARDWTETLSVSALLQWRLSARCVFKCSIALLLREHTHDLRTERGIASLYKAVL